MAGIQVRVSARTWEDRRTGGQDTDRIYMLLYTNSSCVECVRVQGSEREEREREREFHGLTEQERGMRDVCMNDAAVWLCHVRSQCS